MSSKMRNSEIAKQSHTFRVSASVTDVAIFDYLSALGTPRALAVWLLYSNKEHTQLVDLEIHPADYSDGVKFQADYLATLFLSKADFLDLPVSKKDAAMSKFFKFEELCCRTNNRFRNPSLDPSFSGSNVWLLNATRRKIEMILGDFSPDEFVNAANWGPGVSTLLKGESVSAVNKFQCETGITHDLYSLVSGWFQAAYPRWGEHLSLLGTLENPSGFTLQRGNVIVTVPKNSKTDRVIAVEPGINLWFEKAIGSMIRRRLNRHGIDLNSQDWNQHLAGRSAKNGLLATVDFSSASDSISTAVVQELIPARWYTLMDACRSKIGLYNSKVLRWNKFSSMGNGFTFELESLIFYAAALVVCEYLHEETYEVSVFGDDVIIPTSCYKLFASYCDFLGFKVNFQKSFFDGYFRESCGSHYFAALDCKPVYLKERLRNVQSIFKLANGIRLASHRLGFNLGCDRKFYTAWRHLFNWIPKHFRFVVSRGLGDVGFIGNFDEACPSVAGRGYEGYRVQCLIETGVTRSCEQTGMLLARLRGSPERAYGNNYTLRGRTRTSVASVLVHSWYNLGAWI